MVGEITAFRPFSFGLLGHLLLLVFFIVMSAVAVRPAVICAGILLSPNSTLNSKRRRGPELRLQPIKVISTRKTRLN